MFNAVVVVAVGAAWLLLRIVDDHLEPLRFGRRTGRLLIVSLGTAAMLVPDAFAAGTRTYVDRQANNAARWLVSSLENVLDRPSMPPVEPGDTGVTDLGT